MMNKKIAAVVVGLAVLIIVLGVAAGILSHTERSKYAGVYLSTGDILFGKLDMFPVPRIINPYTIQRNVDKDGNASPALVSMSDAIWSPGAIFYLNSKNVVYWAPIKPGSEMAQMMDNPEAYKTKLAEQQKAYLQQMQQQQSEQPPAPAPATSSKR
jgi:hypothetical protein